MAKLILFMKIEKEFESAGSCRTKYIKKKKHLNLIFLILSACLALLGSNVAIICLCFFSVLQIYIHTYMYTC